MDVVVCVKQIIDPETTPEQFKLDPATRRQARGGLPLVISAFTRSSHACACALPAEFTWDWPPSLSRRACGRANA